MRRFIGVDLAWRSERNHTGAAVLAGNQSGAELVALADPIHTLEEVRQFIACQSAETTFIAIDAPLIIGNPTGQRCCETAVGRRYGSRHAACHTSSLKLYPSAASVELATELLNQGYTHAPVARGEKRVLLEVYPHAAMVALFDLPKIIKYKKGTVMQKRKGLRLLTRHMWRLRNAAPALHTNHALEELLTRDCERLRGVRLKMYEDMLDAVFCAYLAYYFWFWALKRNEVFGNAEQGYIVNPTLLAGGIEKHAA